MPRRIAVLLALVLLLSSAQGAIADTSRLYSLITGATGITRAVSTSLADRAEDRVLQIATDFSHCCVAYGEGEVLGWNRGKQDPEPSIVEGWMQSPGHRAILTNPDYHSIGCAELVTDDDHWFVCILSVGGGTIPNTAMR